MSGAVQNQAGETCILATESPKATEHTGGSLAATLYDGSVTIALVGELGAGKTTFLRGFFQALGTTAPPISPTYALEQRHPTRAHGEALHLDLYRLSSQDAKQLLGSTDDHPGIRAVEWFDRIEQIDTPHIALRFDEVSRERRTITARFGDVSYPTKQWIMDKRREVRLPPHVAAHCDAVASFCDVLADALIARGTFVRKALLHRAAELHDLCRFVDFRLGASPPGFTSTAEDERTWKGFRDRHPGLRHEAACAKFLEEHGYDALAKVVLTHGLALPSNAVRVTTEQKLLYYADKRVNQTQVVSLDERFADFATRYGDGTVRPDAERWHEEARRSEAELFPEGAP